MKRITVLMALCVVVFASGCYRPVEDYDKDYVRIGSDGYSHLDRFDDGDVSCYVYSDGISCVVRGTK